MNLSQSAVPALAGQKKWQLLGLIGLVAVTAGLVVPQLLPSAAPSAAPAPSASTKNDPWQYSPPNFAEGPDLKAMLVRLGVGTAVVLVLCVGTLVLAKRWMGERIQTPSGERHMRLVESLTVGHRCSVHLLTVGSQQVLVGVDAGGVKTMVALPPAFEPALVGLENAEATERPEEAVASY